VAIAVVRRFQTEIAKGAQNGTFKNRTNKTETFVDEVKRRVRVTSI
jgi:hypothetical protein